MTHHFDPGDIHAEDLTAMWDIATFLDGQVPVWDAGTARFVPGSGGGGAASGLAATRLSPSSDTFIDSQATGTNHDTNAALVAGSSWASSSFCRRILMTFDTTALAGKTIRLARLRLVCVSTNNPGMAMFRARKMRRAYVPNQVTWNVYQTGSAWGTAGAKNVASDISAELYGSTAENPIVNGEALFNITSLLKLSIDAAETTFRFIFGTDATSADNSVSFHSLESATAAARPTLDVVYDA